MRNIKKEEGPLYKLNSKKENGVQSKVTIAKNLVTYTTVLKSSGLTLKKEREAVVKRLVKTGKEVSSDNLFKEIKAVSQEREEQAKKIIGQQSSEPKKIEKAKKLQVEAKKFSATAERLGYIHYLDQLTNHDEAVLARVAKHTGTPKVLARNVRLKYWEKYVRTDQPKDNKASYNRGDLKTPYIYRLNNENHPNIKLINTLNFPFKGKTCQKHTKYYHWTVAVSEV